MIIEIFILVTVTLSVLAMLAYEGLRTYRAEYANMRVAQAALESRIVRQSNVIVDLKNDHTRTLQEERNRHDRRLDQYLAQIQTLANQIATIRLEVVPPQGERVVSDPPLPVELSEPMLPRLRQFIESLESDESQTLTEQWVYQRRDEGLSDEEILRRLESEDNY